MVGLIGVGMWNKLTKSVSSSVDIKLLKVPFFPSSQFSRHDFSFASTMKGLSSLVSFLKTICLISGDLSFRFAYLKTPRRAYSDLYLQGQHGNTQQKGGD